jgi:hypothetical protein
LNRNFYFFLVKSGVEMSIFDQKRMKIRFFQNFDLCIVSDVNMVTEKQLRGKICILCDASKRRRRALRIVVHRESCQSYKSLIGKLCIPEGINLKIV